MLKRPSVHLVGQICSTPPWPLRVFLLNEKGAYVWSDVHCPMQQQPGHLVGLLQCELVPGIKALGSAVGWIHW